ncbi:MAG: ECF transporter S component [Candidatus Aminicenantes bacterium]|nr:ECF transporter S component [Candidatus Aminicenantes bacterium]
MNYSGRDLVLGGLFLALALALPVVFHAVGLGRAFLPMFLPIVTAGFLTVLPVALTVGMLSPLTSAALTGMPPFFPPVAFIMMIEGIVLAGVPSLLRRKLGWNIWGVLALTVFLDRLLLLVAVFFVSTWLDLPEKVLSVAAVIEGFPGILILFLVVPVIVGKLEKILKNLPVSE